MVCCYYKHKHSNHIVLLDFVLQEMTIARSFLCKARANIKRDRIFESQNRHKEQKRIGQYDIKNEHVRKVFNTFL